MPSNGAIIFDIFNSQTSIFKKPGICTDKTDGILVHTTLIYGEFTYSCIN